MTIRETAKEAVKEQVAESAKLGHERNYHKLHVYSDGSVSWTESINRSDDLIDSQADDFRAIPSVITTGTGSVSCNCDYCNEVYDARDEQLAKDDGREYKTDEKYDTYADAIADAVADTDLTETEEMMLNEFDEIEIGYFSDESMFSNCAGRLHRP